jgi:methyltransferase-like protein
VLNNVLLPAMKEVGDKFGAGELILPFVLQSAEVMKKSVAHLEQYMDFVRNRQFRQTLLCHRGLVPKRALSPAFLHGLLLSCRAVTEPAPPDLTSMKAVVFATVRHRAELTLPASKAALTLLMEAWPRAIDIDELSEAALERAAPFLSEASAGEARGAMMADLFRAVLHGMIRLHTQQLPCTNQPSDTPRANALAAHQAETGNAVVTAHHEVLRLEPLGVEILKLANGQRRRSEILDALVARGESDAIAHETRHESGMTPGARRARLEPELQRTIASLGRSAVLVE